MIVDLSVVDRPDGLILVGHGLEAERREIYDAEAPVNERTMRPLAHLAGVGAAMLQRLFHLAGDLLTPLPQPSGNSAHKKSSSPFQGPGTRSIPEPVSAGRSIAFCRFNSTRTRSRYSS